MKKELKHEHNSLKDALKDLNKELRLLRSNKFNFEKKLEQAGSKLDLVQTQKSRLQNLISISMRKEAHLTKRQNSLKDRIAAVEKKIEKVKSIGQELKGV